MHYFRAPEGQIALVEVKYLNKGKRDRVLVRGSPGYKDDTIPSRLIHSFAPEQVFTLVIPKERVVRENQKNYSLAIRYTVNIAEVSHDPWQQTQTFWEKRKEDFIQSFLQQVKRMHQGGTFLFHLIEEG